MPYEKYVAENIFGRAEMTSTGYPRSDRPEADIAIGYTVERGTARRRNNTAMHGVTGSAAGGGYSTALDLLTYVKAVRAGRFPGNDPTSASPAARRAPTRLSKRAGSGW